MSKHPCIVIIASFLTLNLFPLPCEAGLAITPTNGEGTVWTRQEIGTDLWKVKILQPASNITIKKVAPVGANGTVIAELEIVRPTTSRVMVEIGNISNTTQCPKDVEWIHTTNDQSGQAKAVSVSGRILGTLKKVEHVNYLTMTLGDSATGGDLNGPVTCIMHPTDNLGGGWIDIASTRGNLRGNVTMNPAPGLAEARLGFIQRLDFTQGEIGQRDLQNDPVDIEVRADGFIDQVFGKEIHARIMGTDQNPSDPKVDSYVRTIGWIETNPAGLTAATGEFTGEIRADWIRDDDYILGPIAAHMLFRGDMKGRIWLQGIDNGPFYDQHINPKRKITMLIGDLLGSVSYSSREAGGAPLTVWRGPVQLLDTLTGPINETTDHIFLANDAEGYDPTLFAGPLGGGAVGLVPFRLHRDDIFPLEAVIGEPVIFDMIERPTPSHPIRMRFYGPVNWFTGVGVPPPFKIERRRIGGCSPIECWTDESCGFTPSLESVDGFVNGTVVLLTPFAPVQRGFEYRITLNTDPATDKLVLRCDLPHVALADAEEVVDFSDVPILFQVCDSPAEGDADDDGVVDYGDVTNILSNFGLGGCPYTTPSYIGDGDADRDGDVDFADVTAVLTNFNATWCVDLAQSIGGGGDGFATMDLESEMSAAAASMAIGDALVFMGYASIEAFVDAIAAMDEESRNTEVRRLGELLEGTP